MAPTHGSVQPSPAAIQAVAVAAPGLLHHAGPCHAVAVRLTRLHPEAAPRLEQPLHRAVQVVPLVCEVQIRQLRSRKSGMAGTEQLRYQIGVELGGLKPCCRRLKCKV